jgi:hypothetical protein
MTGLILSPTLNEFHFNGPLLSLAMNIGLLAGAILWSFGSDIWGRKSVTFQPPSPGALLLHASYMLCWQMVVQSHTIRRKYIWNSDGWL